MLRGWLPQVLPHSRQRSSYVLVPILRLLSVTAGRAGKNTQLTQNPFSEWEKRLGKCESISLTRISWSPLPGESWHLTINRSGCRGVLGLVPQPLCMKFPFAQIKSKLGIGYYNRRIGLSSAFTRSGQNPALAARRPLLLPS